MGMGMAQKGPFAGLRKDGKKCKSVAGRELRSKGE
jgi:hypothetical protein